MYLSYIGAAPYDVFMARQAQQQQHEVTDEACGISVRFHTQRGIIEQAAGNGVRLLVCYYQSTVQYSVVLDVQ